MRQFSILVALVVAGLAVFIGFRLTRRSYAASPPPAGGYFNTAGPTPPGAAFPTESQCAAQVNGSPWEPRANNATPNHTVAPQPTTVGAFSQYTSTWNNNYRPRITGNFTGTTDQIIQWVACKWGWSDDLVRAEAVTESNWNQANYNNGVPVQNQGFGDYEARSNGHCAFDFVGDPCPTSYSIIQIKWYFHPAGFASNSAQSSYPWITKSTAYALDLQVAEMRGCYDGLSSYLGNTTGDYWGCMGYWFSGAWHDSGANSYISQVQNNYNNKPWRSWADQGGGDNTPPTVSITTPSSGSVSGTVNLTASATDNVAVAGVQFKVDGVNVGSEDVTSPYNASWNSTTASNGNHTITAVARDAAGNTTTSSPVVVTVSNITKPGDANGDGQVGIADLSILATHWGQSGTLSQGDLNGDGSVGIADLSILATNWGT